MLRPHAHDGKAMRNMLAGMAKSYSHVTGYYNLVWEMSRPYNFLTSTARPFGHSGHNDYYNDDNNRGGHDDDGHGGHVHTCPVGSSTCLCRRTVPCKAFEMPLGVFTCPVGSSACL